jgi:hypothetical protein
VPGKLGTLISIVRETLLKFASEIEEGIEYGILSYPGLAHLAAQKHYVSSYVAPKALAQFKIKFDVPNCGKSCLRTTSMEQFDQDAILALLELAKSEGQSA